MSGEKYILLIDDDSDELEMFTDAHTRQIFDAIKKAERELEKIKSDLSKQIHHAEREKESEK